MPNPDPSAYDVRTNSITIPVHRTVLLDYGLIEPTPEERAEREATAERVRVKKAQEWATWTEAQVQLANLTDPIVKAVVALHWPTPDGCRGCDPGSYAADYPAAPCTTLLRLGEAAGITMPDPIYL